MTAAANRKQQDDNTEDIEGLLSREVSNSNDSRTKWVVGAFLGTILAVNGFFLQYSYTETQNRLNRHQDRIEALDKEYTALQMQMAEVLRSLDRMEKTDIRIVDQLDAIRDRLEKRPR